MISFRHLLTASCYQQDPQYLLMLEPGLLDEGELGALSLMQRHLSKFGRLPVVESLKKWDKTSLYVDETYEHEALGSLFEQSVDYLIGRYFARASADMRAEFDETDKFPISQMVDMSRFMTKASSVNTAAIGSVDRDHLYGDSFLEGGVDFGFSTIDSMSGGILPGELALMAARTGVGKSLICAWLAVKWAREGKRVLFVSSEMSTYDLTQRIDGILGKFNSRLFREKSGRAALKAHRGDVELELELIKHAGGDILFPEDKVLTVSGLMGATASKKPDVVLVDGVYLIRADDTDRTSASWEKIKSISNRLKQLALGEEIPVFATTQLKRGGNSDSYSLEDIAYSDALGQDSDLVISASKGEGMAARQITCDILKNRHGESYGGVTLEFDWDIMHITEKLFTANTILLGGGRGVTT